MEGVGVSTPTMLAPSSRVREDRLVHARDPLQAAVVAEITGDREGGGDGQQPLRQRAM